MFKVLKENDLEKLVDYLLGGESKEEFDPDFYLKYNVEVIYTEVGCCDDNPVGFTQEEISRMTFQSEEFNYFWRKLQEVE